MSKTPNNVSFNAFADKLNELSLLPADLVGAHGVTGVTITARYAMAIGLPVAATTTYAAVVTAAGQLLVSIEAMEGITHVASIDRRYGGGGGWRRARCTCGWLGDERQSLSAAFGDADEHEKRYATPRTDTNNQGQQP